MAYDMAWRNMAWYMISPGGHNMVYGMAWSGVTWYIVWPGGHGMVYRTAYVNFMFYSIALGYGPVHMWRSRCSYVQDPFTSRLVVTCMFRSHAQLLFTLGRDSKLRDCEYIYHCSGIEILTFTVIVW